MSVLSTAALALELLWRNDQIANRDFKLKVISIRKTRAEKKSKTYTQVQRSGLRDSANVQQLRQIGVEMV